MVCSFAGRHPVSWPGIKWKKFGTTPAAQVDGRSKMISPQAQVYYKRTAYSLYAVLGFYVVALAWLIYISIAVGELQNPISIMLWGSLTLWCARSVQKLSAKALKWSIALFLFHIALGLFYVIFPLIYELTFPLLLVSVISGVGVFNAWKARRA